ncbi:MULTISPECIES: dihydrodipicolinate synthase family protein [unclassified Arthrobacter]|uniref:dihydrodipicolinate synthase family protein n=1 Tax=unclassified Arthrobacter TaxID=235627 RepID=UPI001C856793|nr:dihydrodipicolinate synthase family protein [Arthrobacter sp. MAHUQ-56]MBX7445954.1 dihydrodipicolinate synthase family protein [Arthrobacter sp. MAHUQ-56]
MRKFKLVCAPVTPFTPNGDLDLTGVPVLYQSLKDAGIEHLFTPGTTAEFTALGDEERLTVISTALNVFGPDGVFAHIGAATSRHAVDLARRATALGAIRLAAITPYFITAGPSSVVDYYRAIAQAVPAANVYAYIFPDRATTQVTPETLASIAQIPGVTGAKLSGMTTETVASYKKAVPPWFEIYSGNDAEILDVAAAGCDGTVSGVSNVYPRLFVAAATAINSGHDASHLKPRIRDALDSVSGGDIALLKTGVALRGLPSGPLRISLEAPSTTETELLRNMLS